MNYSLAAFSEPRGVMRIFQFIFAICAFATTSTFSTTVVCDSETLFTANYPFSFVGSCKNNTQTIPLDVSSDAQFFVATGVLSLMYCIFIIAVYALLDDFYRSKSEVPLADFMLTVILAIFWLSGSAAWSNGTVELKRVTNPQTLIEFCTCEKASVTSFSKLNTSLVLGFLNFFLWASDLWFLYKETIWFQGRPTLQPDAAMGGAGSAVPNI
uniref:Putative conserved plasma membrane protein n=1 Tax=Tabanus bromius TaxID=304241 RepID=A0A0K8TRD2_TABBR